MQQNADSRPLRKFIDCRDYPNEFHCSLRISGTEDEVLRTARCHTVAVHGLADTPELVQNLREMMLDEYDAE